MRLAQVPGVALVPHLGAERTRARQALARPCSRPTTCGTAACSTPDLNRWLEEALARHAPPAVSGRRIKIRYITQPSARPPTFVAFCSRPEELPQSYIRYLTQQPARGVRSARRAAAPQSAQGRKSVR